MAKDGQDSGLLSAVSAVFAALEPLDHESRQRVVSSALSLLGMEEPNLASARAVEAEPQPRERERALSARPISPVELIQDKSPATNSQRIALFAYYREKYEGSSRFSRADLRTYFGKAKEPPPANYDRDFASAVKEGWIHEDGSESYLTSRGLEAVEAGFGGKARPRGRAATKKKATRKKTASKKTASKKHPKR